MTATSPQSATDLLRTQHQHVKAMFADLERSSGPARADLFDQVRATLAVHETVEEMVVHPAARHTGEAGERVVKARLAEESEAKSKLAELEDLTPDGEGFAVKLAGFTRAVLAHAEAEDQELFPILEANCDAAQLERMGHAIERAQKLAPTHAHPHGPESAIGNYLIGPFVAMVDKVRDALHDDNSARR
jgi:hemerythrin superfamily protein